MIRHFQFFLWGAEVKGFSGGQSYVLQHHLPPTVRVTIGEIERGIENIGRRDGANARVLGQWLQRLLIEYSDRILPVDLQTGRAWGRITAGPTAPLADALTAATAKVHDLVVVTRNVRDCERCMPIGIVSPWDRETWVRA
jgi:predicted nucleic acid-binding protein